MDNETSDRDKIKAAFKELRKLGWKARFREGEFLGDGTNEIALAYNRQKSFDESGQYIEGELFLDWEGDADQAVSVLRRHGLPATWDNNPYHAIAIQKNVLYDMVNEKYGHGPYAPDTLDNWKQAIYRICSLEKMRRPRFSQCDNGEVRDTRTGELVLVPIREQEAS